MSDFRLKLSPCVTIEDFTSGTEKIRGVGQDSLLPLNLGDSLFLQFFGASVIQCKIIQCLSWGVIKSSQWVWIWKYCYFKWSSRPNSDGFGISFIPVHNITSFQKLKKTYLENSCKPIKNLMEILKKCPPPPWRNLQVKSVKFCLRFWGSEYVQVCPQVKGYLKDHMMHFAKVYNCNF